MNPTPQTPPTLAEIEAALDTSAEVLAMVGGYTRDFETLQSLRDQLPQLFADAGAYREMMATGPVAHRGWFDEDNGARWLFTLWPDEERLQIDWQPLYTRPATAPAKSER